MDLRDPRAADDLASPVRALTPREQEILQAITDGLRNAEIAASLRLSLETVKSHVRSILLKLQVRDRTQAVVTALRLGLVALSSEAPLIGAGPEGQAPAEPDASLPVSTHRRTTLSDGSEVG